MFLAQLADVPPDFLKWAAVVVFSVLAASGSWAAVFFARRNRIEPQPLDVRKISGVVSMDIHHACHGEVQRRLNGHDQDIKNIYARIENQQMQQEAHASERSAAIYRKIDEVRLEVTDKIDSMPDRIIKTLSELGLLKRPNGKDAQ